MIFIPSIVLTGHRPKAVPAKLFNMNRTQMQMDFSIRGSGRGMNMRQIHVPW